ncbi:thiamine pyrophosphate-dependent enzyme [Pseudonocardia kujensis]|uniref:thiamine pyrophosphate-dependent enzyme n=1 Tax=Pseudonocardia kujensis TaxID=1128675 RepID=UPI001E62ABAB|nr:thiamine pyrophosphate-dependent enzyme [Pseudonocardia kujensis]MCE0762366.1 thiamine pyrophosphate-dependent enzyme [Pseudonocardia kujensis]
MEPTDVAAVVLAAHPHALVVAALGTATSALRLASDDGPHLYLGGAMGSALATALGVAEAVPERTVVALLGDGELLMSANGLWSVAAYRPANLVTVVLTDGLYSITGGQPLPVDPCFADVAGALPGLTAARVSDGGNLRDALLELPRPALVEAVVRTGSRPGPSPFVDPGTVRTRFTAALRATAAERQDTGQEVVTCTADR